MKKIRRKLFFWLEKLQISKNERIIITSLLGVVLSVSLITWLLKDRLNYSEENYSKIEEEFKRRSEEIKRDKEVQDAKYEGNEITEQNVKEKSESKIKENEVIEPVIVNINTADIKELQKLKGIGFTFAKRIVDYRNENGKFESIDELLNVKGIGKKRLETLKEFVTL